MRVIAGKYKGRKLEAPLDMSVRPTTDKVREAVFDILMNDVSGAVFCDLFAGSGAMGIEALSRGASKCILCDSDRVSIRLIRTNLRICGAGEEAVVMTGDFRKCLRRIKEKVDIFYVDPPYDAGLYGASLSQIEILDLLSDDGIIIAEHDSRTEVPESTDYLEKVKDHRYGKTTVTVYRKKAEDTEPQQME